MTKPYAIGTRVELHPATSEWMQGDRYGVVVGYGKLREYRDTDTQQIVRVRPVRVKLDKSGRTRRFHPDNVSGVNPPRRGRTRPPLVRDFESPRETLTRDDLSVTRLHNGAIEVAAIVNGYRESRVYYDYDPLDAVADFLAMFGGGTRNPKRPRRTKRLLAKQRDYAFFRAPSRAGITKPAETAQHAKELLDAERWAFHEGVDYRYYYGRDADEDATSEWEGRIDAVHPDGTIGSAYGDLGNDYSQRHVKAEAALDLMLQHRNPGRGGRFRHHRLRSPRGFVTASFRTVRTPGGGRVILGHRRGERARTRTGRVRLTPQAILTPRGKQRTIRKGRKNPPVAVLGLLANPPLETFGDVTRIEYRHRFDGKHYYHDFKPGVTMRRSSDGRKVTLARGGRRVVKLHEM